VLYTGHPGANYRPPRPLGTGQDDDDDDDEYENNGQYSNQHANDDDDDYNPRNRNRIRVFKENKKLTHQEKRNAMKKRRLDMTGARPQQGTKEWVLMKKAERRGRGDKTHDDSKYTMRRR
ncbi:MAG: hypothetical protein COY57_01455, partial [Flavobacteriales bacterium CG_4_10_14_0_8_um_filter_32_5]